MNHRLASAFTAGENAYTEMLDKVKAEFLWSAVRPFGNSKQLQRVREYIEMRCELQPQQNKDPIQNPTFGCFPELSAKAWHEASDFPWTEELIQGYSGIRNEFNEMRSASAFRAQHRTSQMKGSWDVYYFFAFGRKTIANCRSCPKTTYLIQKVPGAASGGIILFSSLSPGFHVSPHCGTSNTRLRCHLGIKIPEGCSIRVGSEERLWSEGQCLVFDDSFEHEAWNRSDEDRWVLLLDFWHPELTEVETKALSRLNHLFKQERQLRSALLSREATP